MRDRAVLTTAMSSMSIAVAAHTTTRVQRWMLRMGGGCRGRKGRGVWRASRTAPTRASVVSLMVRWSYLYPARTRLLDESGLSRGRDGLLEHLAGVVLGRPAELLARASRVHHDRHAERVEPLRLRRHERQPG